MNSYISEAERRAYGDDLLNVIERKAVEAFQPYAQRLENQNRDLRARLARGESNDIYALLDSEIAGWRELNTHPDFLAWLQNPDSYSGQLRANMLRAAFHNGNANIVRNFFQGFLNEHPQFRSSGSSQRPSRSQSNSRSWASSDAPVDGAEIERFYDRVRRGEYNGRDEARIRDEVALYRRASLGGVVRRG
jgi:hypothetical protein